MLSLGQVLVKGCCLVHTANSEGERCLVPPRRTATIHDVARAAGVAIGTVSKALSGQGKLRAETRQRVLVAAERLNYRPNDLAHSLRRGRTFTVGLLTNDLHGRFSMPLLAGIEDALGDAQISVFLCNVGRNPSRERQHVESLLAKRVDGLIVAGARTDARPPVDLDHTGTPVLYAFARTTDPRALCLVPDNLHGGQLATAHLLAAGRRRVAHVTGPEDFEGVRARQAGMEATLAAHELDCPTERILHGSWTESWGREATLRLLEADPAIDAIFCGSDLLARGTVDALRERGRHVPDDVAVIGFDNWPIIAAAARPPLSSIDMRLETLGRLAGGYLLDLIDGQDHSGILYQPCQLVCRASCGGTNCTPHVESTEELVHW